VKPPIVLIRISAAETRPLRQAILRPHQPVEELVYPGDDSPEAAHFGAFLDGKLIGIASVYHEAPHGGTDEKAWRLRGMAVVPQWHRKGIGSRLLGECIEHAKRHGATTMWFNARTTAVPFYQAHGFQIQGEQFVLPAIGPHYLMCGRIG
jgi:GNAT superfamily N-acetyltransferase